jgi:hypothetical protein
MSISMLRVGQYSIVILRTPSRVATSPSSVGNGSISVYTPSDCSVIGHTSVPAIVLTDCLEDIATVCLHDIREIGGSSLDVVPYI